MVTREAEGQKNWIPENFQAAADNIGREAVKRFVKKNQVIGLGSGPMAAAIVRKIADFQDKSTLGCIPTSFQIKLEAEFAGLRLADESLIPEIDVVFDGADEIDGNLHMIKGGGGALLREKIIHHGAKHVVISAEATKYVPTLTWPVPIEVHPFATHLAKRKIADAGGIPRMRMLKEGYAYVSENGNFVLDTSFDFSSSTEINRLATELKNIPGVIEVGLFAKRTGTTYFKAKEDGTFDAIADTRS